MVAVEEPLVLRPDKKNETQAGLRLILKPSIITRLANLDKQEPR